MLQEHIAIIHAVELVTRQDDEVVVGPIQEGAEVLPDCVGSSLVPRGALGCLLGRKDLHEAVAEVVELVAGVDVPVQRGAVELGQHIDAADA